MSQTTRPPAGTPARVHFNLHTRLWSVSALRGPNRGRVIATVTAIALSDCRFVVSAAGRQRVLRKHQRAVHAWITGTVLDTDDPPPAHAIEVSYNPYRSEHFQLYQPAFAPVCVASAVYFTAERRAFATDPQMPFALPFAAA